MSKKNIIFDFGGVLINLDPQKSIDALNKVCGISLSLSDLDDPTYEFFHQHEMGKISNQSFIKRLQDMASTNPTEQDIIDAWNAMLLGWNPEKLSFLQDIRSKANIYLLSNTNDIHLSHVIKGLKEVHQITDFNNYFKIAFYSHEIGYRKPNQDIYRYVLSILSIPADEVIFIDDNKANIESAIECGMGGIVHSRNASLDYVYDLID